VSRQLAIMMRLVENASKGQTSAIALSVDYQQRFIAPLLEREEHERRGAEKQDYSCLSNAEKQVLLYILSKVEGEEEIPSDIVGVIPIYRPEKYIFGEARSQIVSGLCAYGLSADQASSLVSEFQRRRAAQETGDGGEATPPT
jgi:hypothetical protein